MDLELTKKYLAEVQTMYKTGHAREHAYRPALNKYFIDISGLTVVNDPKRSQYGAPDFVFLKGNGKEHKAVIAYAEAKDLGASLDKTSDTEQLARYYGYSNLILTNSIEFRFYRNGLPYGNPVEIAKLDKSDISVLENNFVLLEDTLKEFLKEAREPITSGNILAKVMAGKARRIRDNIKIFLKTEDNPQNKELLSIYKAIKALLLADLDHERFADMYAQTLVYGLFVARYHDPTSDNFSRQEARDLVPASNPFLRHFFDHIAGNSFDKRIEYIVNELCEEFTHTDVRAIVHNYFKTEKDPSRDPIIHFYEDFLKEYNPKERIELGVFYTPLPVVHFIVRSIDEILKTEFGLKGLHDETKIEIQKVVQNKKVKEKIHKVQLLDPATGTGTFLNETILHIKKSFAGQEGRWAKYVKEELLPRLHGFELMIASYTIAHLKLATTLNETGADAEQSGRIGIYLTNSLEKIENKQRDLFSFGLGEAITEESRQAGKVKNDLPIMVVFGNPPYSGISHNKQYTENNAYKLEPGGKQKLKERKHWLDDDYVKFIRFAESLIEKNQEGVVGMITAHGYLDNPTFRGMRWHLAKTFDKIHVLDLHGNSNKKEKSPSGGKDENVFDIQQGVAILLATKSKKKEKSRLATVYHSEVWGTRDSKHKYLLDNSIGKIIKTQIKLQEPNFFFIPEKSNGVKSQYVKGFKIDELLSSNVTGIVTARDSLVIDFSREGLLKKITLFVNFEKSDSEIRERFFPGKSDGKYLAGDTRGWKLSEARKKISTFDHKEKIIPVTYRPLDNRFEYYCPEMVDWGRWNIMKNFLAGDNFGLVLPKQFSPEENGGALIVKYIGGHKTVSAYNINYYFPLYIYEQDGVKFPNFNHEIYKNIISGFKAKVAPENVLDYIYAILYSPGYREKYKEFLKIDFPRVPYPASEKQFFELAKLGEELRKLHLLEHPKLNDFITTYPEAGNDEVEKLEYKQGKVYINKTQYFGNVPQEAWDFYIGGYQPAQRWLKDRKGHALSAADISHYQKIIAALSETNRVMKVVDKIV